MRKAINENPVVQISVIGMLLVLFGVLLATRGLGGEDSSSSSSSVPEASATGAPAATGVSGAPSTSTGAPVAPTGSGSSGASETPAPAATVSPDAMRPGPGMPAAVVTAWRRGEVIVLLVVRSGGVDDRLVRRSVARLSERPRTAVFVTRAKGVARYSRITQGVGVSRVPALVVIRPRRLSGSVPRASVAYGFRDSRSVVQAVQDALYSGKDNIPYYPR